MDSLRIGLFVLFGLLPPVSCGEFPFTEPLICYMLDGILILYCLIATVLYFREKVLSMRSAPVTVSQENVEEDYQMLEKPTDTDPYQVLEPTKRKKKSSKEK